MAGNPVEAVLAALREEAAVFRRRGLEEWATFEESLVDQFEEAWEAWWREPLGIPQASEESGYSEEHLRELVRSGVIPDERPEGSQGRIRIRRCSLPKKPGGGEAGASTPAELLGHKICL